MQRLPDQLVRNMRSVEVAAALFLGGPNTPGPAICMAP